MTGNAAGDFAVASDTCSSTTIPAGGTCTIGVAFTPTNVGSRTAVLILTDATGIPHLANRAIQTYANSHGYEWCLPDGEPLSIEDQPHEPRLVGLGFKRV